MNGILLLGQDNVIESRAKRNKVGLLCDDQPGLPFDKTLITEPGTRVPWELLPAAWVMLEKWDAAVPLWRYDATAQSVGTVGEREETRLIIRDIRVLLHAYELLFVRKNEAGEALVETWLRECSSGPSTGSGCGPSTGSGCGPSTGSGCGPSTGSGLIVDKRLAFLRALYHVKPRLCVLPTSWLSGALEQGIRGAVQTGQKPRIIQPVPVVPVKSPNAHRQLVTVELQPGRLVKCHRGDEEKVKEQFRRQMEVRHHGHR